MNESQMAFPNRTVIHRDKTSKAQNMIMTKGKKILVSAKKIAKHFIEDSVRGNSDRDNYPSQEMTTIAAMRIVT